MPCATLSYSPSIRSRYWTAGMTDGQFIGELRQDPTIAGLRYLNRTSPKNRRKTCYAT
jgi:hypothetical protein